MKNKILAGLVVIAGAIIVVSFFMPWANVVVSVTGVSKELTGIAQKDLGGTPIAGRVIDKLEAVTDTIASFGDVKIKTSVSGYDIPTLVNSKTSKVAISLTQIMFKSAKNVDMKSYLVYLLPLLGIACVLLSLLGLKNKIFVVPILIISGIIAFVGLYNLHTADFTSIALKMRIEGGLWNTMHAFAFIFLIGIIWLLTGKKS